MSTETKWSLGFFLFGTGILIACTVGFAASLAAAGVLMVAAAVVAVPGIYLLNKARAEAQAPKGK